MKRIKEILSALATCALCILFTACPDDNLPDDPKPNEYTPIDNPSGGSDLPSNDRGAISYSIDGQFFKTVLVEGGSMGDFYMMQTEIPPGKHVFQIEEGAGKGQYSFDGNNDNIIVKIELFDLITIVR